MENNIYIRVINKFKNRIDGFNYQEITQDKTLNLSDNEKQIIESYLKIAYKNRSNNFPGGASEQDTLFLCIKPASVGDDDAYKDSNVQYIINFDSQFKYIDYIELKEARKNAHEAKKLSWIAIIISCLSILVAIFVSLFVTQTVKVDSRQINTFIEMVNKK